MQKKIVIYKDFFRSGRGADRVTATLANRLASRGYDIHVVTQQSEKTPFSVSFDPAVSCHSVASGKPNPLLKLLNKLLLSSASGARFLKEKLPGADLLFRKSRALQACIHRLQPDAVLSAGTNECVELTYAGPLNLPLIQMFHVYPSVCFRKNKYQRVAQLKAALPEAVACQVLLPSHRETLAPYTSAPVHVIGNAVSYPADEPLPEAASREQTLVYVAYFSKDKNQSLLLQAFAALNHAEDWTLKLYGSGTPEWEKRLRDEAEALGITGRVHFCGITDNPREVFRTAGICAYPSRVEGFGLALAEAMWMGVPCVGLATAPGVNELIEHGVTGLLAAEDAAGAFATELQKLIDDPHLRSTLGSAAAKQVRRAYSDTQIWDLWDDFIAKYVS